MTTSFYSTPHSDVTQKKAIIEHRVETIDLWLLLQWLLSQKPLI